MFRAIRNLLWDISIETRTFQKLLDSLDLKSSPGGSRKRHREKKALSAGFIVVAEATHKDFPARLQVSPGKESRSSLFAVDHPRDAESVGNHAEAGRPERLLERHAHLPAFSQCVENTLAV